MPTRIPFGALLPLALLAGGCAAPLPADLPQAEPHPPSVQKTARAIHHWDVLADDVAARLADKMRDWPPGEHPIYVSASGDSSFNAGFRKLLLTRLLDRGVALSTGPTAVELKFDTQLVQHDAGAAWMPLDAQVSVVRDPYGETGSGAPAAAAPNAPARAEILVTTSVESGGRYLARTADVYSVEQRDTALYQPRTQPAPSVKTWRVVTP